MTFLCDSLTNCNFGAGHSLLQCCPLNSHQAREVIFKVPDNDDEEMKDKAGDESAGSTGKRSLQQLLELENPPKPDNTSGVVDGDSSCLGC